MELSLSNACACHACSVSQFVAVRCSVLKCVAVCCSVLQCAALCCSVLQRVAVVQDCQMRVQVTPINEPTTNSNSLDLSYVYFGFIFIYVCLWCSFKVNIKRVPLHCRSEPSLCAWGRGAMKRLARYLTIADFSGGGKTSGDRLVALSNVNANAWRQASVREGVAQWSAVLASEGAAQWSATLAS